MDCLKSHKTIIKCLYKIFECIDEEGKCHTIKGIYRPISTQQISVVQLKKCFRKGCQLYAIKVVEIKLERPKRTLEQFPILKEFQDVFPDEIPLFPPKRDLDFTIDLMPRSRPIS